MLSAAIFLLAGAGAVSAAEPVVPSKGLLLVVNKGDRTLSVIDPASGKALATIEESGVTGHEVIASPDGRTAYVPIYGNAGVGRAGTDGQTIDVIDLVARKRVETIDLGRAERPHCALFGADGRLYVTTEITNTVTVIDPQSRKVVDRLSTGQPEAHMLALTKDGTRGYTSNVGAGTVSVLDLASKKVVEVIPVAKKAQRVTLSVDDRLLFTADQNEPRLAVIDTAALKIQQWIALPGIGYGAAPTPDGRWLVIALVGLNKVARIDLRSMAVDERLLDVPSAPQFTLMRPDGRIAYVSCDKSAKVAAIDIEAWTVERLIDAGDGADGLAWAPAP